MKKTMLLNFLIALALPLSLLASSHREAPLISEDPTMDNTDVYVFRSPDAPDTVTIVANYIPFEEPAGGPNFHNFSTAGVYEIHVDNDGDAREDVTFQFRFRNDVRNGGNSFLYNNGPVTSLDDENLLFRQYYTATRIAGNRRSGNRSEITSAGQVAPANIGPKSTPDYPALAASAVKSLTGGVKVFAGPRDDPFFVDLGSVFDLATLRPVQQLHLVPPMAASAPGVDGLKGYNVHSIVIQLPLTELTRDRMAPANINSANAVIGVWATASRPRVTILGGPRRRQSLSSLSQVSRLGSPLVNEVVVPYKAKDLWNVSEPSGDTQFLGGVTDPEVPKLLKALYNIDSPPAPRNDLVQVFLTGVPGLTMPPNVTPSEQLRINLAVPPTASASVNPLGVIAGDLAGFPNGRRLVDDVTDIELRVLAGVLVSGFNKFPNNALTDGVQTNDKPFLATFPYVALPSQGFESRPHAN